MRRWFLLVKCYNWIIEVLGKFSRICCLKWKYKKMLGCYYCFVIPINNRSQCSSNNRFALKCLDFPICKFISFRWVNWQMPVSSTDAVGSLFKEHSFYYLKFLWKHCCVMHFFLEQKNVVDKLEVGVKKMIESSTFSKYTVRMSLW